MDASQGACSTTSVDPDVFFPSNRHELTTAQKVCAECPIALQCLRSGQLNDEYGVWGGQYLKEGVIKRRPFNGRGSLKYTEPETVSDLSEKVAA